MIANQRPPVPRHGTAGSGAVGRTEGLVDLFEELAAAQRVMVAAERRRARAAKRHREATAAVRAAQRDRIDKLRAATADGTPETMRRAAAVMGISLARPYQLLREDDARAAPTGRRPDGRRGRRRPPDDTATGGRP
jgi:hypothetical protein